MASLPSAEQLTGRQYLVMLNFVTSGQVSRLLAKTFPSSRIEDELDQPSTLAGNGDGRFRRASLDTLSGLSLGYSKRKYESRWFYDISRDWLFLIFYPLAWMPWVVFPLGHRCANDLSTLMNWTDTDSLVSPNVTSPPMLTTLTRWIIQVSQALPKGRMSLMSWIIQDSLLLPSEVPETISMSSTEQDSLASPSEASLTSLTAMASVDSVATSVPRHWPRAWWWWEWLVVMGTNPNPSKLHYARIKCLNVFPVLSVFFLYLNHYELSCVCSEIYSFHSIRPHLCVWTLLPMISMLRRMQGTDIRAHRRASEQSQGYSIQSSWSSIKE